jgi:hypothetical protein
MVLLLSMPGGSEWLLIFIVIAIVVLLAWQTKTSFKKIFGVIFLLVGLILFGAGISIITNVTTRNNSYEGKIGNTINPNYREENNKQQGVGYIMLAGGAILFFLGLGMALAKTNKQKQTEIELEVLKKINKNNSKQKEDSSNIGVNNEAISQIEKLGKLKEQGLITEEEFKKQKGKILG